MGFVSKTIRHTQRYSEIAVVLAKYGMGDIVRSLKLAETFPFIKKVMPKKGKKTVDQFNKWQGIRMALEELGPTFIKLGQMLSNRPDIVPPPLIDELEKLQDTVPPFEYGEAVSIIEKELGRPLKELFKTFNKKTVAAASVSQVYKASLYDGACVAVKVQRPGIEETVKTDLEILHTLAALAENNIADAKYFNPAGLIGEFEEHLLEELDFKRERYNIERFRGNFAGDKRLHVLKAYKDFSSKRVLTMEFIDGIKVSKMAGGNLESGDRRIIAENGAQIILKQIFIDGYFHADPHPGNIMILENNKICFIDFGMMGSLTQSQKEDIGDLIVALMYKNSAMITVKTLTIVGRPDHPAAASIEYSVQKLLEKYLELPLNEINIAEVLLALMELIAKYELRLPSNFSFMIKSLITIEGVGRQLDPDFKITETLRTFSKKIIRSRLSFRKTVSASAITLLETKKLLEAAPRDIREILRKAKQGRVKIEFEHRRLGKLIFAIEEASNRLVFGFTLGALIVGSSIMVHAGIAPKAYGIPLIGLIGFMISGIMAVYIIIAAAIGRYRNWKKEKERIGKNENEDG